MAVSTGELRVTLAGRLQVNPEGVDWETDMSTTPENLLVAATVTMDVPCESAITRDGTTAPADMVKSATVSVNALECGPAEALVPMTVTK